MTGQVFHHNFDNVENYLHHRPPYLMVGAIESIADRSIDTRTRITGCEHFIMGHFPGAAVVPGAIMQEMTTQSAGILIGARFNPMKEFNTHDPFFNKYALGVLIRVKGARYRGFARPGDTLRTHVELVDHIGDVFEFRGRVTLDDKVIVNNSFQLANILSSTLQGSKESASDAENA